MFKKGDKFIQIQNGVITIGEVDRYQISQVEFNLDYKASYEFPNIETTDGRILTPGIHGQIYKLHRQFTDEEIELIQKGELKIKTPDCRVY